MIEAANFAVGFAAYLAVGVVVTALGRRYSSGELVDEMPEVGVWLWPVTAGVCLSAFLGRVVVVIARRLP